MHRTKKEHFSKNIKSNNEIFSSGLNEDNISKISQVSKPVKVSSLPPAVRGLKLPSHHHQQQQQQQKQQQHEQHLKQQHQKQNQKNIAINQPLRKTTIEPRHQTNFQSGSPNQGPLQSLNQGLLQSGNNFPPNIHPFPSARYNTYKSPFSIYVTERSRS